MRMMRQALCVTILCVLAAPGVWAQRDLTPLDVVTMKSVSSVYPSPDGMTIAFTRSEPRGPADAPGSAYSGLYVLTEHGERPLVAGERSIGGVTWHPGGAAITFLERREGDNGRQLYALPMSGGEAWRVFNAGRSIGQFRWRPDGNAVAFSASEGVPQERVQARSMGFRQTVVDEDWAPIGLYLWLKETGTVAHIPVPGNVYALEWSPDGAKLALALAPRALTDDSYMFKRIYVLNMATGNVEQLADNPGKLGQFQWSPDSRSLAYISAADSRDPHAGMLYLANVETGAVESLTPDFDGMVHSVAWQSADRLRLVVSRGIERVATDFNIQNRSWSDLPTGEMALQQVVTAGNTVAAVVSGPRHPAEVYAFSSGSWERQTNTNPWLDEVRLSQQVVHRFRARDGLEIEGLLLYPLDFQEGTRYPLVIVAHGGPESHYNNQWVTAYNAWGQLLTRKGYFVWYPNYRSSTGRGVEFAKADHGDPMGREFEDHLDAIAHFADQGWIDRDRVGIGGGSYGGYTAAWAATRHSEHFAASVSFVPITHVPTKWLTSDIPWEFYYVHYEEQWPHLQWDFLSERSPLTYAANCTTPLLLAGGTADPRVHPSQPFMLYRAVETSTDTPVRYIQYPGEGHGNRVNVNRYDYALRALRWFDHYLQPGDHRTDAPPPLDLDYSGWKK